MFITTIIGFLIYLTYTYFVENIFGIPNSLSNTYYMFKERSEKLKYLFPAMMWSLVILLMPTLLTVSTNNPFQFTAFLSLACIAFTGTAPAFNSSKLENNVHTYSAILGAIFALLWIILVAKTWFLILLFASIVLLGTYYTKTLKSCIIYHLEDITILSVFCSALWVLI